MSGSVRRIWSPTRGRGIADFSTFYTEHAEPVLIYLAKRCLDPEVAVDLMAEAFAQAYASRHRFRGRSDQEASAWIFAIARNQLNIYLRRGRVERKVVRRLGLQVPSLEEADEARIEELADLVRIRSSVREHFERLSAQQQEALRLRVIEERPYPEVARCLGVSEDAARARVSRGLRRLARSLDQSLLTKGAAVHD
jgi:RNA polymerase sigma factor (sigma-70 family)